MNVQLKHGWVLQKGQIPDGSHPVCNHFSSSLCSRTLAQVPFALQHHKKLPGWCQWPSSRNSKFCCTHNMKLFSFSGSYPQGKREGRCLAVLGSSISTTEHPEPLCLSGHSSFPSLPLEVITVIPQAGNHRGLPPVLAELSQDPTWSHKFQNNPLRGAPTESAASHGTKPPAPERLRGHRGTTGEPAVLSSVCSLAWH